MKKLFVLITLSLSVLWLVGCNTVEGMGKDISKAGDAIEGAAKKSK
jgi:predicted small secreted protein